MAIVNIIMPKLGESIMEATVLKWHKQPGDFVKMDEVLLDIATDKVDSEVPSTAEGILEEILCKENDVISIGSTIAKIRTEASETAIEPINNEPSSNGIHNKAEGVISIPYLPSEYVIEEKRDNSRFYSPLVINIATQEGIPLGELEKISGTGTDGRITKKDVLLYIQNKQNVSISKQENYNNTSSSFSQKSNLKSEIPTVEVQISGNVEIVEMDRMRKLISEHMTRSKATSAHVTSFAEADVTNLVIWREKVKKDFEKRENEKITFTPLFIEAIAHALKKFPWLNSSVIGDKIIIKKDLNIGMAAALPNGNLIVPVIKAADQLSLIGIAKQVNKLANAARNGKLQPTDTQDGTFTFTNVGTFGSLMGTPIINQPQVAILAVGAIKKRAVVIENENGDSIAIRHMMFVSISYDHRIIDGAMGSSFLKEFVKELESYDVNRSF